MKIVHLISEYSSHEAMGRTVTEAAMNTSGSHHIITTKMHDNPGVFASALELGGRIDTFPVSGRDRLHEELRRINPDVVHLHAGALGPGLALAAGLGKYPLVMTIYAWPNLPGAAAWKYAGLKGLRSSNVLPTRVLLTAALPGFVVRRAIRKLGVKTILTPDPRVIAKLSGCGAQVVPLPSGAPVDSRRAVRSDSPVVLFAGRSENVRGIKILIDAFEDVVEKVPDARLRLLLLPRGELADIKAHATVSPVSSSIEVSTEPIKDLLGEMAKAQVGVWPFLADYTTSPPAMAALEAMSVGLPVVGTDTACIRAAMRPGIDGITTKPGDKRALGEAVVTLLESPVIWEAYASAGVTRSSTLTWAAAGKVTSEAYTRETGEKPAVAPASTTVSSLA